MTISLCMIVKNEENVLARCLDTVADLMDEIIIVDTGSTDATKEIAARYTDKVYDFEWINDFSAARNFSFEKATCDYIYAPDADEVLDEVNRERFKALKENLIPEIDIVQMHYITASENETVLNSVKELRPKLFKRLRIFTWTDPVHEIVRLDPVVFDSDVEILHMPEGVHGKRDFAIFIKALERDGMLSKRLSNMYARELLKTGDETDLANAEGFARSLFESGKAEESKWGEALLAKLYRLSGNDYEFMKIALCDVATTPSSETCCEIAHFYFEKGDYSEAAMWYQNAAYETEPVLDIHSKGSISLGGIVECYEKLLAMANESDDVGAQIAYEGALEDAKMALDNWEMPM